MNVFENIIVYPYPVNNKGLEKSGIAENFEFKQELVHKKNQFIELNVFEANKLPDGNFSLRKASSDSTLQLKENFKFKFQSVL